MTLGMYLSATRRVALALGHHALVRSRRVSPKFNLFQVGSLGNLPLRSFHTYGGDDDVAQYIPDPEVPEVVTPVSGAARVLQAGTSFGSPSGVGLPLAVSSSSSGVYVPKYDDYSIQLNNLPYTVSKKRVEQEFAKYGAIKKIRIELREDLWCSTGSVKFEKKNAATIALQAQFLRDLHMDGKLVEVKPKESAQKLVFTDQVSVYNEMVLSLPLSDVENPGIHGLWPCNIVDNRVVVLSNKERVDNDLYKEITDACLRKNFRGHLMKKLIWRPLQSSMSQLKFWIHECKTHNVYEKKLFRGDYFDLAMNLSEDYLYRLPSFVQKYRTELRNAIKLNMLDEKPFDPEVHALKLFSDMANKEFGKKIRINVVEDCRLELGFLHDEANNNHLIDHPLCHPQATDVEEFYKHFL